MNPKDTKSPLREPIRRRKYDEQFKRDAVALLETGRSGTQLARELGISQWNLRDWKRLFGSGGDRAAAAPATVPSAGGAVDMAVELADLRRELEAVRGQRDILKKALAIVAQEPANATR